jgi:hypothetical protein
VPYSGDDIAATRYIGEDVLFVGSATSLSHEGAVTYANTGTLSIAARLSRIGAVVFANIASLAVAGSVLRIGSAAFANVATLSVSAIVAKFGAVVYANVGSFAAAASVAYKGAVSYANVGTLAVVASVARTGAVAFANAASLSVAAIVAKFGSVAFVNTGTFAVAARLTRIGSVTFSNVGSLAAAGEVTAGSSYLFEDQFSAASGDVKDRVSTSGHTWIRSSGQFNDTSGKATAANGAADSMYYVADINASDYESTVTFNLGSRAYGVGPIYRLSNATNFWLYYNATAGSTLYECNAGAFTARASNSHVLGSTTDYPQVTTCSGTSISAVIDGVTLGFTSSFNQTAEGIGMYSDFALSGQTIAGFTVEAP